jgi:hypothetical protein
VTIKKDDRVKANNYPGIWTVRMVEDENAWCRNGKGNHLTFQLGALTKVPDFFEVGKTYFSDRTTFDCHYVGQIGGSITGSKYAAGQMNYAGHNESVILRPNTFDKWTTFDEWTEI